MSNFWILKNSIHRVETEEFESKPRDSFGGLVDAAEIVDIICALYDISDIEGYVRMDRVENVYFTKSSRLYHRIHFGHSEGGYSLVVDMDRYNLRRIVRNTVVCGFFLLAALALQNIG